MGERRAGRRERGGGGLWGEGKGRGGVRRGYNWRWVGGGRELREGGEEVGGEEGGAEGEGVRAGEGGDKR